MFIGSDILLNNCDLALSNTGDIEVVGDQGNIVQTAVNNMRTILGEWFIDESMGNAIFTKRIKNIQRHLSEVEQDCISAIMYDIRIKSVKKLTARYYEKYKCVIDFTVETTDGELISSNSIIDIGGDE